MLIIRDIVNNREESLHFNVNTTLNISVDDLLRKCQLIEIEDPASYLLIYDGVARSSKQSLKIEITEQPKVIYICHAPNVVCGIDQYVNDELSIQAAKRWINESYMLSDSQTTAQLALALKFNETSLPASNIPIPPDRNEPPADARGRLRRFIDFIQLGLIVRLGVLFAILQYNRSAADIRTYYIAGALVAVYLLQSGVLSHILTLMFHWLIPQDNFDERVPPGIVRRAVTYGQNLVQEGVHIPTNAGFLNDMAALIIGIFGSFFPGWQPRPQNNRVQ